jgi:peptide/nickel transport system ATP-binding protein
MLPNSWKRTGRSGWIRIKYILKKYLTLKVEKLSLSLSGPFRSVSLVNNFDLQLAPGETVGLVGESGSGKTITALSLLRLLPENIQISAGRILFDQEGSFTDLAILTEKEMREIRGRRISMIFQEPMSGLNPVITCGKQVTEAILAHKKLRQSEVRTKVLDLFNEVRLPDPEIVFNKYPHQLSGGQLQRIMIAMAISCEPDILIADEPTTALDVTVQKSIIELLQQIQTDRYMSILFISHDLGVIKMIADRVLVMYRGDLVETGKSYDIYHTPVHPYTKGLIACRPRFDTPLRRLPTVREYLLEDEKKETSPPGLPLRNKPLYDNEPVLKLASIDVKYPVRRNIFGFASLYHHAINSISLEVFGNETLGIIGESGSGKTTIGRAIVKLINTGSGNIWYKGKCLSDMHGYELKQFRRQVQIIFQDPYSSLNPKQKTGDMLMEVMKVHNLYRSSRERRNRSYELLEKVNLDESSFHRYPHEFSGGQRQRIGIARALAVQPEFIICDESVSGLDVSIQAEILNLLNDLKEDFGLTYIFISHDLSVVKYMSDRILVLKEGKFIEEGTTSDVFGTPRSPYTLELLAAMPG